jgi:hypothetical protein
MVLRKFAAVESELHFTPRVDAGRSKQFLPESSGELSLQSLCRPWSNPQHLGTQPGAAGGVVGMFHPLPVAQSVVVEFRWVQVTCTLRQPFKVR